MAFWSGGRWGSELVQATIGDLCQIEDGFTLTGLLLHAGDDHDRFAKVRRGMPGRMRSFRRLRGFTVPVAGWIAGRGRDPGPLVANQPGVREACRRGTVENLFAASGKRQGRAAWNLLFFALWHRVHILGLAPEGDVFETLASET